jgi:hypothetical protein
MPIRIQVKLPMHVGVADDVMIAKSCWKIVLAPAVGDRHQRSIDGALNRDTVPDRPGELDDSPVENRWNEKPGNSEHTFWPD